MSFKGKALDVPKFCARMCVCVGARIFVSHFCGNSVKASEYECMMARRDVDVNKTIFQVQIQDLQTYMYVHKHPYSMCTYLSVPIPTNNKKSSG